MLVVIPVSNHDAQLIEDFCDVVNFLGPYEKHDLLVVSRPSDKKYSDQVLLALKGAFRSAELHVFATDGPIGWPKGPNFYWHQTITFINASNNPYPWFWMELDITPIEEGWLDAFEEEYFKMGKPCLGVIQSNAGSNSCHLVGIAVYPRNIGSICDAWEDVLKQDLAFDVACQFELVPNAAQSELLQHNFRTEDYRCTSLGLKGIDRQLRLNGVRFDNLVRPETMLVHGCTDGSLARLILNKGSNSK